MRLMLDANILFAALLRDGTARRLLLEGDLDLHTPEWIWDEMTRNRAWLVAKSGANLASLELLTGLLRDAVHDVPAAVTDRFLDQALRQVGPRNSADAPYVATALALDATLWTQDKTLAKSSKITVVTTAELVARLRES